MYTPSPTLTLTTASAESLVCSGCDILWSTSRCRTRCKRGLSTESWSAHAVQASDTPSLAQNMLQAGLIVAGWDKREGGSVYALPLGGTLIKVPFSIGAP